MKRVYSSYDYMLIGHLKGVLDDHGIACMTRNEYLIGGAGDLPPNECWPEIWVVDDADRDRARTIVDTALADPALAGGESAPMWQCAGCAESIEGQFTACWNCGAERGG